MTLKSKMMKEVNKRVLSSLIKQCEDKILLYESPQSKIIIYPKWYDKPMNITGATIIALKTAKKLLEIQYKKYEKQPKKVV